MIEVMCGGIADVFSEAHHRDLRPGEHLFRVGEEVRSVFWIVSGVVSLSRTLPNGDVLTVQRGVAPTLLAEASLFAPRYHCDGIAETDARVSHLPTETVRRVLRESGSLATLLASVLAQDLQALRTRVEILRLHRLSDRLDAYIALHGEPPRGQWVRVAEAIGVTPPALYRELGRRRAVQAEGGIEA